MDIFCKISNKKEKSYTLFEDEDIMAILDVAPFSDGHVLIIPKEHYQFSDIPSDILEKIMVLAQSISKKIKDIYNYDGVVILSNSDKLADVPHFHLHVYGMNAGQKSGYEIDTLDNTFSKLK